MKIFGLLFSSFDKFKIFKSHYMTLRFFALLINIIFCHNYWHKIFQTTTMRKNCETLPPFAKCNSLLRPVIWLMTAQTTTDSLSLSLYIYIYIYLFIYLYTSCVKKCTFLKSPPIVNLPFLLNSLSPPSHPNTNTNTNTHTHTHTHKTNTFSLWFWRLTNSYLAVT
jgi:hypothetical protein